MKNFILALKKGSGTKIGIMQATTFKAAKEYLALNKLDPENYTYEKKPRKK
jgi:hypothetical protein